MKLRSGTELEADVIVTATGLNLLLFGGVDMTVDGEPVDFSKTIAYKGMMVCGVPNFALALGYTNASWTLKCDLVSHYVCRLMNHMNAHGYAIATPQRTGSLAADRAVPRLQLRLRAALHRQAAASRARASPGA